MKSALYRSVWFWLGCFVQVFLVWAWVNSYRTWTAVYRVVVIEDIGAKTRAYDPLARERYGPPRAVYDEGATLGNGRIMCPRVSVKMRMWGVDVLYGAVECHRSPAEPSEGRPAFKARSYHDAEVKMARVQRSYVEVPMWGIVGLYVMGWGGVLVWRGRRWKRSVAELSEVE